VKSPCGPATVNGEWR